MKFKNITKINEAIKDTEENVIYTLKVKVTDVVRLEKVTLFTINDGKDNLQLVKYMPGQSAYPDIVKNSIVTFSFKKANYQNKIQGQIVDVKNIEIPKDEFELKEENISKYNKYFSNPIWEKLDKDLKKVAKIINDAIEDKKPIILSHHGDCDGYSGAMLLERTILHKIHKLHPDLRYLPNYYNRNSSKTPFYDISDATKDISSFQANYAKVNDTPLIVIVDNGSTNEDILAIEKVKIYGADVVVVDHHDPGELDQENKSKVCKLISAHSNPYLVGLDKNVCAAILCFRLAYLIDSKLNHSFFTAAVGAVADRSEGDFVDELINNSNTNIEYLRELAKIINYEIYFTKYAYGELPLKDLLIDPNEKQEKLLKLYKNQIEIWDNEVKLMFENYLTSDSYGKFNVNIIDAEKLVMWNDYYSIGKLTGFAHRIYENKNIDAKNMITLAISDSMIVFRVKQEEKLFDGNKLIAFLEKSFPYSRISGGGHDVAGSIKFIPASKDEILDKIKEFIKNS